MLYQYVKLSRIIDIALDIISLLLLSSGGRGLGTNLESAAHAEVPT